MAKKNERSKFIQELQRAGYDCERARSGHWKVKIGARLRERLAAQNFDLDSAPPFVVMSSSPSDPHAEQRALRDLKRIGYVRGERR